MNIIIAGGSQAPVAVAQLESLGVVVYMKRRPLMLLFATVCFVIISLVFAHFRRGFNSLGLVAVFMLTFFSFSVLYDIIWPEGADCSLLRRGFSLIDFIIAGLFNAWFAFGTFDIPTPHWVFIGMYILVPCKLACFWVQRRRSGKRKLTLNPLQMRMFDKDRKEDA